ncbi:hypothetical protein [Xylanibacter rarus]|uniref:hypothetical protein n=1 Tax=Xylanibacter rarus TaxID=1676614 RepID=UPI0012E1DCF0|nr:hypothetical protein [Xylanibacter rarus]
MQHTEYQEVTKASKRQAKTGLKIRFDHYLRIFIMTYRQKEKARLTYDAGRAVDV